MRRPALALALTLLPFVAPRTTRAQTACTVQTPNAALARITVHPAGENPLTIGVTAATLRADVPAAGQDPHLFVEGTLRFDTVTTDVVWYAAHAVTLASNTLTLASGAALTDIRANPAGATADVEVAPNVSARAVDLPCDALAIGDTPPAAHVRLTSRARGAGVLHPPELDLALSATPGGPAVLHLEFDGPEAHWPAFQTVGAPNAGWVHVRAQWSSGAAVDGWVERARFVRHNTYGTGIIALGSVGAGCPDSMGYNSARWYQGPATVRAGTQVFTAPDHAAWATVTADATFRVLHDERSPAWVQILAAPGIRESECVALLHLWVPSTGVVLPPNAHPAGDVR